MEGLGGWVYSLYDIIWVCSEKKEHTRTSVIFQGYQQDKCLAFLVTVYYAVNKINQSINHEMFFSENSVPIKDMVFSQNCPR